MSSYIHRITVTPAEREYIATLLTDDLNEYGDHYPPLMGLWWQVKNNKPVLFMEDVERIYFAGKLSATDDPIGDSLLNKMEESLRGDCA